MIIVNELRLSFMWVEAWPDLLVPTAGAPAPFAALGQPNTYAATVKRLVAGAPSDLPGLTLPWIPKLGKSFWTLYLGRSVDRLPGETAWTSVLPLRLDVLPAKVTAPWLAADGRAWGEAFFYPHGAAFVFNATCVGDLALPGPLLEVAWQVRNDERYGITWPDGTSEALPLPALAAKVMTALRRTALGGEPGTITSEHRPFSVASVVRGTLGSTTAAVPVDGDPVHAVLEGLTNWNANYLAPPPGPVAPHLLATTNPSPGNLLYANPQGRATWLPSWFVPPADPRRPMRKVGCYHRNLTMASLQVESLALLCRMADERSAAGNPPTGMFLDLCKRAGQVLGRLHGDDRSTYRTRSVPRHVADNHWRDTIDRVGKATGVGVLVP